MTQPASLDAALARLPLDRLRVLEPACGPGQYLAHFGPGSRGIDRNPAVVEASPLAITQADLDQPGWSKAVPSAPKFEAAFLCDVLMHVADPAAFLAELPSLLEPRAPIVLVEWVLPPGPIAQFLARRVPGATEVFSTPKHLRTLDAAEVPALFKAAGYRLQNTWLHSFEGNPAAAILRTLIRPFWPARTWLFTAPASQEP